MFRIEDTEERSREIRLLIAKLKTVITKIILKMEERGDYKDDTIRV